MQIVTAGNAAASAILAIALAYLWRLRSDERGPAFWSAGLLLFAFRQILILLSPDGVPPSTILALLSGVLPSVLFYIGTLHFLECPTPAWRLWAVAGTVVALALGTATGILPPGPGIWATVIALAAVYVLTALAFLRGARDEPEPMYRILAVLFFGWGVHALLYPVYGMAADGRALYAIPTSVTVLATSVALIIATQRRMHLRTQRAQDDLEASNRRFQDFVETATAWIWEMDAERRMTFISPRVYDSLGIPPTAFIGRRFDETPGIANISLTLQERDRIYRPDQPFRDKQLWITTTDGRRVHVSQSGKPVFDAAGRHTGFRGIAIDITQTTRLQAALNAVTGAVAQSVGPDYFRLLVEHLTKDLGVDFALVGQRLPGERIRALASYGDGAHQAALEYDLDGTPCAVTLSGPIALVESGAAARFPRDAILGELGIDGYAGVALRDSNGEAIGLIAVMSRQPLLDTELLRTVLSAVAPRAGAEMERQIAEAALRQSENLFRTVIDNTPLAFQITDIDSRLVMVNRTLESWLGRDEASLIGRTLRENGPTPKTERIEAEIKEVSATRRPLIYEGTFEALGRPPRPALVYRFPILDPAGNVTLVGTVAADLTELKQLEAQARQSDARLQRVVSALDLADKGVVVEDTHRRPIYANRTAGDLMGLETSALAILERAGVGGEFGAQGSWSGEIIHRTRRGADAILQVSAARLPDGGTVTLLDDATERLERERRQAALERQVLEAQKMDAVGQLAGGIAHDFNNLVGAILGFSRFILEDTDAQSRVHGYAGRILSASQRARDLIQQILAFSRRETAPRQPAALSDLVEESAQLLRATLPSTLTIDIRNSFPTARALVNATQVTQILVNLCLNAADAMGGRSGTLVLSLDRVSAADSRLRWLFAADPGSLPKLVPADRPDEPSCCYVGALQSGREHLVIGVADQGSGIATETLPRIFDPFFTTKARGQGTGLGLPVVQRLVLTHEGAIVVSTRPGQGTLFEILLPLAEGGEAAADAAPAQRDVTSTGAVTRPKGRILVVDDDLHFGDMLSTALDRAGYEVGVCGRPRDALEAIGDQPAAWDVLVTDHTMPEMSGLELIGRMKAMHPGLRCILCTGYASGRVSADTAAAAGADAFFHKPVEIADLLDTIAGLTRLEPDARPARGAA